ncbi:10112_t:CDS:2 [Diversispora eburnea]|uniref:10112_t:CDS:1 n=1 Tax=Diversispora eburnea TaxID=1213867 RepID=A0A9N8Z7P1_9GLOM|nr:10112_t:CDS:2 [Diversispora eburnea]
MIENFNDHAERKVKNEFKYLKACIIDLEYGMRMFHKKLENIVDQCNYMYSDNYDYSSNTSDSETELSDDMKTHKRACLALVNEEIRKQLPDDITNDA